VSVQRESLSLVHDQLDGAVVEFEERACNIYFNIFLVLSGGGEGAAEGGPKQTALEVLPGHVAHPVEGVVLQEE
jgi:hypothetical protein